MAFSQLKGQCFVFMKDNSNGAIKCVAQKETFLQDSNKTTYCTLGGLKYQNLRGDYQNIFQIYGGGAEKGASNKSPLLFTCQNLDNSIKVYDLNIKKGPQLVH